MYSVVFFLYYCWPQPFTSGTLWSELTATNTKWHFWQEQAGSRSNVFDMPAVRYNSCAASLSSEATWNKCFPNVMACTVGVFLSLNCPFFRCKWSVLELNFDKFWKGAFSVGSYDPDSLRFQNQEIVRIMIYDDRHWLNQLQSHHRDGFPECSQPIEVIR